MNLVILFALILIAGFALFAGKIERGFITWKGSLVLAGVYLAVLLASVPLLYLLPDKGFMELQENVENGQTANLDRIIWSTDYATVKMYPDHGDLAELYGLYNTGSTKIKFSGDKIGFRIEDNANVASVFVERKEVNDGEIEISTYSTPYTIDGIDFTTMVSQPVISIQNNTLTVGREKRQSFDFRRFRDDFTLNQFRGIDMSAIPGDSHIGWHIVYVSIPQSLETDAGSYNVRMVTKD